MYASIGIEQPNGMGMLGMASSKGRMVAGKKRVSQSTVSRNTPWRLFSDPFSLAKNEGGDFLRLCAWGTGELKNATLTPLTYIGVDAHDGVHIFRVIARLGAVNRKDDLYISVMWT